MNPKIAMATASFFSSFHTFIPELSLLRDTEDIKNYDLIIFPGGEDIDPTIYGEVMTYETYGVNHNRDIIETAIYNKARELGKKIVGICRGHQLINALEGGKLIQDIRIHRGLHDICWFEDDPVSFIYPKTVNSMHHQGFIPEMTACSLQVTAIEPESGIVEATRSEDNKIITVQFHPEFMGVESNGFFSYISKWAMEA